MNVKGSAWLARRSMLIAEFGQDAYDAFVAELCREDPTFDVPSLPTSKVPIEGFLRFNDRAIDRFYGGDLETYFTFGAASADYFSSGGPYQKTFFSADWHTFLRRAPLLWAQVYDEGEVQVVDGEAVEVRVVRAPVKHVYFEYFIVAFVARGMEILHAPAFRQERVRGFSNGDDEVYYRFVRA